MLENIMKFFKNLSKKENKVVTNSKEAAKERLHLVLMQDRANVSADFLELMKQEIIEVIKKYIDVDENAIDVRLTNKENGDGTNGAPALYANIPILNIKNEARKADVKDKQKSKKTEKPKKQSVKENSEVKETVKNKEVITQKNKTNKSIKEDMKSDKQIDKTEVTDKIEVIDKAEITDKTEKTEEKIKSEN